MFGPTIGLTLHAVHQRPTCLSYDSVLDDCPDCMGSAEPGWVCEDHPDRPWRHAGCTGAGAPCACNPRGAALWAMVYSDALRVADEPVH